MSEISITLKLDVPDQLCKDFLTTACEGGSTYWLSCETFHRDPVDHNVIKVVGCHDIEDPDTKWGDVTLETMREGIRRILSGEVKINSTDYAHILKAVVDPDSTDWDADTADCVLQAGLLNDITYG